MKIVGVDLGQKRVGLALWSDPKLPAYPWNTLTVTEGLESVVESLVDAITQENEREKNEPIEKIIVGLPLRLDGTESLATRKVRKLAALLKKKLGIKVVLFDERLTTSQAHRQRMEAGVNVQQGRASKVGIDAHAAAIILQTYVDQRAAKWRRNRESQESLQEHQSHPDPLDDQTISDTQEQPEPSD